MVRAVVHASELLTGAGFRARDGRRPTDEDCGKVADGALVYETRRAKVPYRGSIEVPGAVLWAGPTSRMPREYRRAKAHDLGKRHALVPGLVDCHTHLVFAGDRSEEFAERCAGATYEEIAAKGGGIVRTVDATRAMKEVDLLRIACARVEAAMALGVRTIEVKSGYGLDEKTELKCLKVVRKLREHFPGVEFQATFLGAHAFPKNVERGAYLSQLVDRMLPEVARLKLAEACDVFVDRGYYTREEGAAILRRARDLGLAVKIHADELANTESAALAAELGCLSADHLLKISEAGVRALAASDTTAVLLPGTAFYLKAPHAPARKLIDAGARVALATDFNPGSSMINHLPAILTMGALYLGMSRAELLCAVTYNGARALGMHGRVGTLEPGMRALHWVVPFERFEDSYYRFAWTPVSTRP
ncbi:MAG TPA: imidazolonepropionase [Bdellovibrionota bacterium]|nr:imidazolonepropionase [Bdellovibrionota bacterium]